MSLFSRIVGGRKAQVIEAAVQYSAPHWIVMIRNPGQKEWIPLLDTDKKAESQNEFGEVVKSRHAIRTFNNAIEAQNWIASNMPGASVKQEPQ
ncbi:hypothetical protein BcepSauron_175 [Burkholderia phage BcepSauron]|uniref:Uncharacterized protein n=1 Tax=Burkholderia phage BcepSauron TaxID=2530033 RepID=A0A482MLP1_9CAUD|nr:hypothetical protein H1O17_gp175 [Burkholderia phage BcepSauron]QBQ74555.1 hypothetical protein BcepSauron_175 [Burkholderia phage BcepSauron]